MNTTSSNKAEYKAPEIVQIDLDNEISLALESTPPDTAPGEGGGVYVPGLIKDDPYRNGWA